MSVYRNIMAQLIRDLPWSKLHGVEIGVNCGGLSAYLLEHVPRISHLIGVDPYCVFGPGDPYYDGGDACARATEADVRERFRRAKVLEHKYATRYTLLRTTSLIAAAQTDANSIDFVIIDGDHREEAVLEDSRQWWGKLHATGRMLWHDYYAGQHTPHCGVSRAVDRFIQANRATLHVEERGVAWTTR